MAGLPEISTGYKPEFGLGALYQGFNAGNADQMAQEDLIKQFLANQRSLQMNPLEAAQAQQTLDSGQYKISPEYQTGMRDMISGQGMSNLAAGQTAAGLQPFKQRSEEAKLKTEYNTQDMLGQIGQLDQQLGTEPNPLTRMAMTRERDRLTNALKMTPEFKQKQELTETKTDSAEYIAELRAELARLAAEAKASSKPENKDDAEKAYVRLLKQQYADGEIDLQQLQAALVDVQNKKFAKPEQQGIKPIVSPEGAITIGNKAATPQIIPGGPKAPTLPSGWTMK